MVTPQRYKRLGELFAAACKLPRHERARLLDLECAGDPTLRSEVETLLAKDAESESFLESPVLGAEFLLEPANKPRDGSRVGDASDSWRPLMPDAFPGYELSAEIQRGGQGIVYRAVQKGTGRDVAIKVMHTGPFGGPRGWARFEREVRILARLKHPNIVTIHDSGVSNGNHFFVMDYIDGQPLDTYMALQRRSVVETLELFARICEAIRAAHLRGVIHRDLKPTNIFIDQGGEPNILDFGLAKTAEDTSDVPSQYSMTVTGQFLGSLPWASPEQAGGTPDQIDLRTDVYSLGVILYHMLTGRFPYPVVGNMREVLSGIIETEPSSPRARRRDVDAEVATIVLKCLAKERDRRYQSAGDLARDVRHYLAGEPIEAKRESTLYVLRKQMRRHRLPIAAAGAFLLLVVVSSIVGWSLYLRSQENLWRSYLAQARVQRTSGKPGQRFQTLDTVGKAAAIRPSLELRNEAIAAMIAPDLRQVYSWNTHLDDRFIFDASLQHYATWTKPGPGALSVRRVEDQREILALPSTGSPPQCARFSPDGSLLARETSSGTEIWDLTNGALKVSVPVVQHGIEGLDFSPNEQELAIAVNDGGIEILDIEQEALHELAPAGGRLLGVKYHPYHPLIATTSLQEHGVRIRDTRGGDVVQFLDHPDRVWALAWSPDGRILATGCYDRLIRLWEVGTWKPFLVFAGHANVPVLLEFCARGDLLFSYSWDGTTKIWDLRSADLLMTVQGKLMRTAGSIPRLALQNDERQAFHIYDLVHDHELRTLSTGDPLGPALEYSVYVNFHPDGRLFTSGSLNASALWDWQTGERIAELPKARLRVSVFHPPSGDLITVGSNGVKRWPLRIHPPVVHVGPPQELWPPASNMMHANIGASDGLLAFVLGGEGAVILDPDDSSSRWRVATNGNASYVAVSRDGRWIATSGNRSGDSVSVWDSVAHERVCELPVARSSAQAAFSPDGRWMVTTSAKHIKWRVGTWEACGAILRSGQALASHMPVAFSPDSRLVAVADRPHVIALIDVSKWETVAWLEHLDKRTIIYLTFSPDGAQLLASPEGRDDILVWDLRTIRQELSELNLDWDLPPYAPAPASTNSKPLRVEIDTGALDVSTSLDSH